MEPIRRVSNVVLYNDNNEVLVQQRTDDAPIYPSYYSLFGGKIDGDESAKDAAIRECIEELNYQLQDPTLVIHEFHDSEYGKREKFIFVEKFDNTKELTLNEGQGMKWIGVDALEGTVMIPHDKHYLKKIFENNFKPLWLIYY